MTCKELIDFKLSFVFIWTVVLRKGRRVQAVGFTKPTLTYQRKGALCEYPVCNKIKDFDKQRQFFAPILQEVVHVFGQPLST